MKTNGKSSRPIIAAQSKKNNGDKPAPPNAESNGAKRPVSRVSSAADEMKMLVLERISDGLLGFDANMNSTYVNERAGEILGCEPQDLLGRKFWEAYPEATGTSFADACQQALETQMVVPFEGWSPPSQGQFEGRVYPDTDGISVLFTNQTEGTPTDQNVDISRLPEQNPTPVLCFTRDGEVLYANPAAGPLLESWHRQGVAIAPQILDRLPKVLESNTNQDVEFQNEGRIYVGFLVPVQEFGQVNFYCRDITERRQSRESLRALINQSAAGVTRTDLDGRFTFVNQAFCEMLGYSESELIGKTIWEVSHPEDIARNQLKYEDMKSGEPYQLEKRLIRHNGSVLWVTVGTSPLMDASGQIWAATSIIVDITRRKRAEESLMDSARRSLYLGSLSDTIRSLSDPAQIQTESVQIMGTFLKASRVAYLEIGRDGNVVSRARYLDGVADIVDPVNVHQYLPDEMLAKFILGRTVIVTDVQTAPGYGEELQASYEAYSIRAQVMLPIRRDEELVAAVCIQQSSPREWRNEEIHLMEETVERMQVAIERLHAEQGMVESEKRFRILANAVPSMVWSTAPDGTILYFNEQWYAYTGLTPEQTLSNWAQLTLHPADYERCMSAWKHALETVPDEYRFEVRYRRHDGEYRWFQSHAIPARDENRNVTAWYGVTTDIDDRKHAETALRESEERLRLATQAARMCAWELDIPSQTYKLGDNFEDVIGFSRNYLPEKSNEVTDRINIPEDLQAIRDILIEAVRTRSHEIRSLQYRLTHPETEEMIWVEVNAKLVYDDQGKPQRMFGMLQNITGRKRKEEQLLAQEAELQAIINQTPFMLTRCSRDLRYRFVSHAYAKMIGRTPEEIAGKPIVEIMGEEGLKTIAPYIEQVLKGKRVEYETQVSFAGVAAPALHVIYSPDYDEQGIVVGWFASITDVTERKAAEEERVELLQREQEQRLKAEQSQSKAKQELSERKLAEAALGTWTDAPLPQDARPVWLRYGIAFVAAAMGVLLRIVLDPLLGDSVQLTSIFGAVAFSVWYGGVGPALFSALVGYLGISWLVLDWTHMISPTVASVTSLGIFLFSSVIIMALGNIMRRAQRHAHQSARVAVERQRQAELRLVEQKRAEEALRESERKFSLIYDNLPFAAALANAQDSVIVDVNGEFERTFGYSKEEAIGKTSPELGINPDLDRHQEVVNDLQQKGTARNLEIELSNRAGEKNIFLANTDVVTINNGKYFLSTLQNITERKQAERALVESARQQEALYNLADKLHRSNTLEDIFQASLDAIQDAVRSDRASILLFDDQDVLSFFAWRGISEGYRKATNGHSPWKPDEKNAVPVCFTNIDTADISESLRTVIREEGIEALAFIPLISNGNLIGKFMVYFDKPHEFSEAELDLSLTIARQLAAAVDRKRADDALRASEAKYRRIVETANEGIWEIDKDARTLFVNQRMADMLGYTVEEIMGRRVFDFLLPEDHAEGERRLESAKHGGSARTREFRYRRKDNGVLWTVASNTPERDEQGNFLGAFAMMSDITERKHAEEALRQSEERFVQFMHNLPGLAWIKDLQGHYVYANAAAEQAFNTPRDQLYGRTDQEIFAPEVAAQFQRNDEQAIRESKGIQAVEQLQHNDGVLHYSLVTKFPIPGADGNIAMIGGTAFDITERVQMEDALKQARERAEETANRMTWLQQVTASLAESASPSQLAELILEQGTRATGAVASILMELISDGSELKTVAAMGYPSAAIRSEPVSNPTPMSDCIQTRQAIWIESHEEFARHYPSLAESRKAFGNEATVALPLVLGDRVLGGLAFSFMEQREFLLEERGFLLAIAQQCAQGMERARAAEALRESEERYRAIVNQATAGIVRKDPNGRLLFVNEAFCGMLGYRKSELLEKTMWQLTHEEDVRENKRLYHRLMRDGVPFELEKRLIRQDGSILWATVSVSPVMDAAGKAESAVSVYADITERKLAEQALQESRERYRDLFNLIPIAVYTCDAEGLVKEYNRSAVELWGREPLTNDPSERYCGSFKIYYPDGRFMPHRKSPIARMLAGETVEPHELEILVERRDGSRRNIIVHPLPLRNEHGEIIGAINCLYDITARKQAEDRLTLLAEVSELTRQIEEPLELMSAVSHAVGRHLQLKRCLFNEIDLENDLEIVHRDYHDGVPSVAGTHKISDYSSATTAEIAAGNTIVNNDAKTDPRTAADYERSYLPNGERAYVAVPLMRDDRWVASLWVSDDAPRQWKPEDIALIKSVGERTWTATEKLRINAALRDSEERLRVTFNTTAVGFATLALDTRFIDVNEAFCTIVGYTRDELLNMNFDSLTHPAHLETTRHHTAQLLAGVVPSFVLEKVYIRKNGEEIWVQNSVSLVRDVDGNPLHLITICQDVTERKQTEEDLHRLNLELESRVQMRTAELQAANEYLSESEATSRLILESMPDAIVITDKEGRIVHCNAQVKTLFGYPPDEALGQPVEILIPEKFHNHHVDFRSTYGDERYKRIMGLGRELFGRRKDQSEFPVDVMLSPISNHTNWDVMVTIRDNTEQRQAQQAIRTNEEKLRTLFEVLPVGISFLNEEGRITELNTALTQIMGLSKAELLKGMFKPRHYVQSDGSPMPPEEIASLRAHTHQKPVYNVETGIVKENGETIWTSVSAAPVNVADVDVVVVTADITERKKSDEALRRNRERLRVLSRRLVEVQEEERRTIARELHDRVGQNLAALNLNLNILRSQLPGGIIEQVGSRISDSVKLVNQILTITRSVMSDLRSNVLDDYGLEAAIREYTDQFTQRTKIQVVIERPASPIPRLQSGIEMTLLRIAQEALTNIARHAQATHATITLHADKQDVYMSVQDDGIGILSWQKANQPGSHGLRIIRERAEAFDGSLQVNSAYKKGTTIEVRIPLGRNNE